VKLKWISFEIPKEEIDEVLEIVGGALTLANLIKDIADKFGANDDDDDEEGGVGEGGTKTTPADLPKDCTTCGRYPSSGYDSPCFKCRAYDQWEAA